MASHAERHAGRVEKFADHAAAGKCVGVWGSTPCRNRSKRDNLCGTHGNSYDSDVARESRWAAEGKARAESAKLAEYLAGLGYTSTRSVRSTRWQWTCGPLRAWPFTGTR